MCPKTLPANILSDLIKPAHLQGCTVNIVLRPQQFKQLLVLLFPIQCMKRASPFRRHPELYDVNVLEKIRHYKSPVNQLHSIVQINVASILASKK